MRRLDGALENTKDDRVGAGQRRRRAAALHMSTQTALNTWSHTISAPTRFLCPNSQQDRNAVG